MIVPPMASQTANEKGYVTQETLNHYQNLSKSGAGIVMVEYSYVHPSGRGEPNQLGVFSNDHIEGLSQIAKIIKNSNALSILQIVHNGGKSTKKMTGGDLLGPSPISVPTKNGKLETPKELHSEDVLQLQQWYFEAARRGYQAGFDGIELHCAHGYGLNQWLSPITNQRTDQYGGSLENRSRFLNNVVTSIKRTFPKKILSVRIPGQDHFDGGLTQEDMKEVVHSLELNGVDIINVSSGIGGWRRPKGRRGQGYLVDDASAIKLSTNLPIIGVGGIHDGSYIDYALNRKFIDFAAVGRAILENPQKWNLVQMVNG